MDPCSLAKYFWEKLQSLYLKKHAGKVEDGDADRDSNREYTQVKEYDDEEEEAKVDVEGELINTLSDLNKAGKKNQILGVEFIQKQKDLNAALVGINKLKE